VCVGEKGHRKGTLQHQGFGCNLHFHYYIRLSQGVGYMSCFVYDDIVSF
jgi:hypothetical protein